MRKLLTRLALSALLLLAPLAAEAALPTITATPAIPQFAVNAKLQLSNGTTSGTVIDCTNASAANGSYCNNGMVVTNIVVTSTDTSSETLTCNVVNNSVTYQWFQVTVTANAGNSTSIGPISLFNQPSINSAPLFGLNFDAYGNPVMLLSNTDKVTCSAGAVTSGKLISIFLLGGAF